MSLKEIAGSDLRNPTLGQRSAPNGSKGRDQKSGTGACFGDLLFWTHQMRYCCQLRQLPRQITGGDLIPRLDTGSEQGSSHTDVPAISSGDEISHHLGGLGEV